MYTYVTDNYVLHETSVGYYILCNTSSTVKYLHECSRHLYNCLYITRDRFLGGLAYVDVDEHFIDYFYCTFYCLISGGIKQFIDL